MNKRNLQVSPFGKNTRVAAVAAMALVMVLAVAALSSCAAPAPQTSTDQKDSSMKSATYQVITPEEAKAKMDSGEPYALLDVRTEAEYKEGHIEGAMLIPDTEIASRAASELTNKDETILVYCRTGRRSAAASEQLANMGYTNVLDFGGIVDWPYEIVK